MLTSEPLRISHRIALELFGSARSISLEAVTSPFSGMAAKAAAASSIRINASAQAVMHFFLMWIIGTPLSHINILHFCYIVNTIHVIF